MRLILAALLALTAAGAQAETAQPDPGLPPAPLPPTAPLPPSAAPHAVSPPTISAPDTWVKSPSGTLRVLNKLDSTVQSVTLAVGQTISFESLSITLQACDVRPPDLPQDAAAHLVVTDSRGGEPGFDGWILQKEPAVNMLEHPVYDIQLAGCG